MNLPPSISEGTTSTGIFWRKTGTSESEDTLVLTMGYGGSLRTWPLSFVEQLARNFTVITYDNRGTGRSVVPQAPEDYSIDGMADDLDIIVTELGINQFHLLGYSMGGCMALAYTRKHQDKVLTLTLLSSTAGGAMYTKPDPSISTALANPKGQTLWDLYVSTFELMYSPTHFERCLPAIKEIYENSKDWTTSLTALRGHSHAFRGFDASQYVSQIMTPTQIISGTEDRLMPVENSQRLAHAIPNSKLVLIPDCEHAAHVQDEALTTSTIIEHCLSQKSASLSKT